MDAIAGIMRVCIFVGLLALTAMLGADDKKDATPQKRKLTIDELKKFYADEKGRITTDWVDTDTRQMLYDAFSKAGYLQVLSEGRLDENGDLVYRKGFKYLTDTFPDAELVTQWSKTGLTQSSFESWSQKLQKDGFVLMKSQSFKTESGELLINGIWVKLEPPKQ